MICETGIYLLIDVSALSDQVRRRSHEPWFADNRFCAAGHPKSACVCMRSLRVSERLGRSLFDYVRFTPNSGHQLSALRCPLSAIKRHLSLQSRDYLAPCISRNRISISMRCTASFMSSASSLRTAATSLESH